MSPPAARGRAPHGRRERLGSARLARLRIEGGRSDMRDAYPSFSAAKPLRTGASLHGVLPKRVCRHDGVDAEGTIAAPRAGRPDADALRRRARQPSRRVRGRAVPAGTLTAPVDRRRRSAPRRGGGRRDRTRPRRGRARKAARGGHAPGIAGLGSVRRRRPLRAERRRRRRHRGQMRRGKPVDPDHSRMRDRDARRCGRARPKAPAPRAS